MVLNVNIYNIYHIFIIFIVAVCRMPYNIIYLLFYKILLSSHVCVRGEPSETKGGSVYYTSFSFGATLESFALLESMTPLPQVQFFSINHANMNEI